MNVLAINLALSTLAFAIAARRYLTPRLSELSLQGLLAPILLLHATRHLALTLLAPGATYAGLAPAFVYPAALGDLLASFLALAALIAWLNELRSARCLACLLDVLSPTDSMPVSWVPVLLIVTQYVTFLVLRPSLHGSSRA